MKKKGSKVSDSYWDQILRKSSGSVHQDLWRASMKEAFQKLLDTWLDGADGGLVLKTDLYDEAVSNYNLVPLFRQKYERVIGTDLSFEVALAAQENMMADQTDWHHTVVSDVRNLAFRANSFSLVFSNSTLDHFDDRKDLIMGLREVFRVLKPGGLLIITLDNPSNPVIYLRNLFPYRFMKFFGIIPYYMGVTLCRSELIKVLESNGFEVSESTAIGHIPRIFLIWIGHILQWTGSGRLNSLLLRFLRGIEYLEKLPTRFLTGYFVAVRAVKR